MSTYTMDDLAEMKQAAWKTMTYTHTVPAGSSFHVTLGGGGEGYSSGGLVTSSEFPAAKPHECPHCLRQRHPEPLTSRMAAMYDSHKFDPAYDAAADESSVVCIGSDYHGPAVVGCSNRSNSYWAGFTTPVTEWIVSDALWESLTTWPQLVMYKLWTSDFKPFLPVGAAPTECNELPITFNDPENWKPWEKPGYIPDDLDIDIDLDGWHTSFPTLRSPGYDFSEFNPPAVKYPTRKKKKNETI